MVSISSIKRGDVGAHAQIFGTAWNGVYYDKGPTQMHVAVGVSIHENAVMLHVLAVQSAREGELDDLLAYIDPSSIIPWRRSAHPSASERRQAGWTYIDRTGFFNREKVQVPKPEGESLPLIVPKDGDLRLVGQYHDYIIEAITNAERALAPSPEVGVVVDFL